MSKVNNMNNNKLFRILILQSILLVTTNVFSQEKITWGWVKNYKSNHNDFGSKVQTDQNGNVYVCINYSEKIIIENDTLAAPTYNNNFCVIKYSQSGKKIWAKEIRSNNTVEVTMLQVDANENVYVGGSYIDSLIIGNYKLSSSPNSQLSFVAKLNRQGAEQWLSKLGSSASCTITAGQLAPNGNLIIAGNFIGYQQTFGGKTVNTIDGSGNFFVASLSQYNTVNWAISSKGYYNELHDMAVDKFDNIYVCGTHNNGLSIDGKYYLLNKTSGGYETYLIKFNSIGTVLWAKSPGSESTDIAKGLAIDDNGNCFVTGYWGYGAGNFQAVFDSAHIITKTPGTSYSFFLAKYSPSGQVLWVQKFDALDNASDLKHIIRTDKKGNCYLTGDFTGIWFGQSKADTITFSGPSSYYKDIAIQQFKPDGTRGWNIFAGNEQNGSLENVADMTFDRQEKIWITGTHGWSDSLRFGNTAIPSRSKFDFYLTQLGVQYQKAELIPTLSTKACIGDFIKIPFRVNDSTFSTNNVFSLQISNNVGLFDLPITIATKTSNRSDTFIVKVPQSLIAGTGYRFRIMASNPSFISYDNELDYTFYQLPPAPVISIKSDSILSCNVTGASAYQWYLNDSIITSATSREFSASKNGLYKIVITNINGCMNEGTLMFNKNSSIQEFNNEASISFYPNPVSETLYAKYTKQPIKILFYNSLGQEISVEIKTTPYGFMANMDNLSNGIYIVHILFEGEKLSQKIKLLRN